MQTLAFVVTKGDLEVVALILVIVVLAIVILRRGRFW